MATSGWEKLGIALLLFPWSVVAAIAVAAHAKKERQMGAIDPFEATGEPEIDQEGFPIPGKDVGDCLVLGGWHRKHTSGRYRVCLTPNQKKTLFKGHKGRKLGCGVFACAYATSNKNRAVKFTRDPEDVAALLEAQKTGLAPEVFDVYKIQHGGHFIQSDEETPVYALALEQLSTFTPAERSALNQEFNEVRGKPNACQDESDDCGPIVRQTMETARKLKAAGIDWGDIHAGNIGLDRIGNVKVLDLGLTSSQLTQEPKILAGARKRLAKRSLGSL